MPSLLDNPAAATNTLWAIVLLPLAGALVNGLFGRRLGRGNVALVALSMVGGSFALSLIAFYWAATLATPLHFAGDMWFHVAGGVSVPWGLTVDRLSGTLLLVVTGVGFLIHVYSTGYMSHEDDAGFARFFTYLNLFVAAMLILVLGDSLVLTFVGWEGVGLASYLLIGFWYTDPEKAYAGRKAFVTNRIGDFGFLLGVFAILSLFGSADYSRLAVVAGRLQPDAILTTGIFAGWTVRGALTFATLGLFVGACGKSAQLPLYVWLPDAMAGPTPVSALIHAATMVTAGVYLVARTSFLFALAPAAMATVAFVGALTALFAAVIAFAQYDLKRILAYSTVSQLGYMFIGVGVGAFDFGIYHLVTHAFFKACLFLAAGSVMHAMHDDLDVRNMGGLWRKTPSTAITFLVATLAITGILPFSGFFSKDGILSAALFSHNHAWPAVGPIAYALGTVAAAGTAFYMVRAFALAFAGEPRTKTAAHAHESPWSMTSVLWILAFLSIAAAVLGLPTAIVGERYGELFKKFTEPVFAQAYHVIGVEEESAVWPFGVAWLVAIVPGGLAWAMYAGALRGLSDRFVAAFPRLYRLVADKFRVDELYDAILLRPVKAIAQLLWQVVDVFAIEGIFVNGVPRALYAIGDTLRGWQNGNLQRYAAVIAIAAVAVLWAVLGTGGH
ncbi:MAG TPA: NADH-quinone oxidoreductase subunit L [Anaeromyxobacteraceae bacterium]|nr:NADH-quinone oxidoreductase subunit L [Anaeromyxobacteraceae bacterium]